MTKKRSTHHSGERLTITRTLQLFLDRGCLRQIYAEVRCLVDHSVKGGGGGISEARRGKHQVGNCIKVAVVF